MGSTLPLSCHLNSSKLMHSLIQSDQRSSHDSMHSYKHVYSDESRTTVCRFSTAPARAIAAEINFNLLGETSSSMARSVCRSCQLAKRGHDNGSGLLQKTCITSKWIHTLV